METNPARGHLAALLTIVIWGTTFISTKVLLVDFQPVEILFIRFMMGFPGAAGSLSSPPAGRHTAAGGIVCPGGAVRRVPVLPAGEHRPDVHHGLQRGGHHLRVSLLHRLLTHFLMRGEERLRPTFFAGFAVAMAGICLISFKRLCPGAGPPGGFAGAAGCLRVGLLRPLVPEDQRPGPSHCPDHAANLFPTGWHSCCRR